MTPAEVMRPKFPAMGSVRLFIAGQKVYINIVLENLGMGQQRNVRYKSEIYGPVFSWQEKKMEIYRPLSSWCHDDGLGHRLLTPYMHNFMAKSYILQQMVSSPWLFIKLRYSQNLAAATRETLVAV